MLKIEKIEKIEVQKLFDELYEYSSLRRQDSKDYVIEPFMNIKTDSVSKELGVQNNLIPYIMKHKVKKRMHRIKCKCNEVTITEDHSMMAIRDNELIEIKPKDVKPTDNIIMKTAEGIRQFNNFEIEDLGILEEWVYDIEVENNHNLFGNNILIHNSVILHIEQFVELYLAKNPDVSIDETIDWMDAFENKVIQPIIQKCINDFAIELNAIDKDVIGCEREILSDKSLFTAKKKYIMRVRDSEGTRYPEDEPYMKVVGVDLKKSGTAPWSKVKLTTGENGWKSTLWPIVMCRP